MGWREEWKGREGRGRLLQAALEAMNGFNLYGSKGTSLSVVYVDIDAHNRNRTTFEAMLPRESASKVSPLSLSLSCLVPLG